MNVSDQKAIVDEILERLELVDPYAAVAGGAPRDWYFGNLARDIDMYFYCNPATCNATVKQLSKVLKMDIEAFSLGFDGGDEDRDSPYATMNCIRRIINFEYKGVKFQLMQLLKPKDNFKVVDQMSASICKVWYKGGKIHLTQDFKLTIASGLIFLNESYNWSDPHPKKIQGYFSDKFGFSNRTGAVTQALSKSLRNIPNVA